MHKILTAYGLDAESARVIPHGTGLINHTWQVESGGRSYILQQINETVFKSPEDIAYNIRIIGEYLHQEHPDYLFTNPLQTVNGEDMLKTDSGCFRIFPFIPASHTIDVVESPEQAYEAARAFGRFTRKLAGFDANRLRITIPRFHDLQYRYEQFLEAISGGNPERIKASGSLIGFMQDHRDIVRIFEKGSHLFKTRVTHHDTKISNVLFNSDDQALCVIDLDTLMPGYFISDLGDMMRTYLCPVNEEEKDFSRIGIRKIFYHALVDGYLSEMREELTAEEKNHLLFSGKFMIYMQALRFLSDHLNDDRYYGSRYEGHNLVRAGNQAALLQRLIGFEQSLLQ
ncbi:MAG: aminoglycoside phosphotransferase family protein [Chitinophagaceae bacterium]|nr:aminoglycoside phosphotransferase family protein [Chitinophagaceae bacterium]